MDRMTRLFLPNTIKLSTFDVFLQTIYSFPRVSKITFEISFRILPFTVYRILEYCNLEKKIIDVRRIFNPLIFLSFIFVSMGVQIYYKDMKFRSIYRILEFQHCNL